MYAYKEVQIKFLEFKANVFEVLSGEDRYAVSRENGLVFLAESKYGRSFATTSEAALTGAMKLIDRAKK